MDQDEWKRYKCQLALPGFGIENQQKLQDAKVLVVGAGGLGCPAALYLAASGIGTIGIADFDVVSVSNLHRQILYSAADVGLLKAEIACQRLRQQNPQITLTPITQKITHANAIQFISEYDIVVDGTDNFETKYLLNDACVLSGKPMVYAAIYQYEGQVSVLNALNSDGSRSPNYRDLYPSVNASQIPGCAEGGVMPSIAGITGILQANEVIKWITSSGDLLSGKILITDAITSQTKVIKTGAATHTHITDLGESSPVNLISTTDLRLKINDFDLIDVRTKEERLQYHIGGMHIPLAELESNLPLANLHKPLVFYCESGRRSAEAFRMIKKQSPGWDIFSLGGGLQAWERIRIIINEK